ncbi:MAG: hypothetical protein FWC95_02020 [Defluviitaleaceae bacterium]|nr:hypothetical protein [Defluviitaleaceae bacterium]
MQRLKQRRGRSKSVAAHNDYWKSFTDVFATICLMFFFVMLVFGILSGFMGNRAQALTLTLEERENELFLREFALAEALGLLDDQQAILDRMEELLDMREDEIEQMRLAWDLLMSQQIADMNAAREAFEEIARYRYSIYRQAEFMLQAEMGPDVVFYDPDLGVLVFDTSIMFGTNLFDISPGDMDMIDSLRRVLFAIIDEFAHGDRLVRLESIEFRGHADREGMAMHNRRLSANRAVSVVNAILPEGNADAVQNCPYSPFFIASGSSFFHPRAGTLASQTPEQMAQNRRVDIIINFDAREVDAAIARIAETLLMPGADDFDWNVNEGELGLDSYGDEGIDD